jgi:hypothetical protein
MVSSRRETARRIAIAYVIVGSIFFLLYQFILNPSYRDNPIVNILFFVFLPAILAAVALVYDFVLEGLIGIPKRFQREDENSNEDAWS